MSWLKEVKRYSDISSNPERQAAYIRAKQAVQDCRNGNIENFPFIREIVKENPFDAMGLEVTEREYELMKADYEAWRSGLPEDK